MMREKIAVKICGLTREADVDLALELGAVHMYVFLIIKEF